MFLIQAKKAWKRQIVETQMNERCISLMNFIEIYKIFAINQVETCLLISLCYFIYFNVIYLKNAMIQQEKIVNFFIITQNNLFVVYSSFVSEWFEVVRVYKWFEIVFEFFFNSFKKSSSSSLASIDQWRRFSKKDSTRLKDRRRSCQMIKIKRLLKKNSNHSKNRLSEKQMNANWNENRYVSCVVLNWDWKQND